MNCNVDPVFPKHVSEVDQQTLKRIARSMLRYLYPACQEWKVIYKPMYYVVVCMIPRDKHLTLEHFVSTSELNKRKIKKVWVQWSKEGLQFMCKMSKESDSAVDDGDGNPLKKRKRDS